MSKMTSKAAIADIVDSVTIRLERVQDVATRYGVTRQGVYKVLKRAGIDPKEYGQLQVSCFTCGESMTRHRGRVRRSKHLFCSEECYFAFLKAGRGGVYIQSSHGQRMARAKVAELFDLQPGHIVHHIDRNCLNNMPENLMVFANQGDHVRHHRGFEVRPLWEGRLQVQP